MHLGAIPFIRLLLPLLLGIGLGIYLPGMVPIPWVLGLILVLLPAWFLSQKRKSVRFSEINLGFIIALNLLLGFALAVLNNRQRHFWKKAKWTYTRRESERFIICLYYWNRLFPYYLCGLVTLFRKHVSVRLREIIIKKYVSKSTQKVLIRS